jgi:hypothetical protein
MVVALPDLLLLAVLIVCLGVVGAIKGVVDFLNWIIGKALGAVTFGLLGQALDVSGVLQPLSNALGNVEARIDSFMGQCFHNLATSVEWVGRELAGAALLDAALAEKVAELVARSLSTDLHVAENAASNIVTGHVLPEIHTVTRVADTALAASVGALTGRLGVIEGEITGVLDPELAALRERARAVEDGFQRAWDLLRQHEEALGIGAVTAATAVALEELGMSWARCSGVGAVGKALCGLGPKLIEDLLAGTLELGILFDLCALTELLVKTAESGPVQDALKLLTGGIEELIRCRGLQLYEPPAVRAPSLSPTVFAYAELAPVV